MSYFNHDFNLNSLVLSFSVLYTLLVISVFQTYLILPFSQSKTKLFMFPTVGNAMISWREELMGNTHLQALKEYNALKSERTQFTYFYAVKQI